eukprot:11283088-Heterocapsa_arctica.AAC.1
MEADICGHAGWYGIWQAVPKEEVNDEEDEAFIFDLCGKSDPLDRPSAVKIRGISGAYPAASATSVD